MITETHFWGTSTKVSHLCYCKAAKKRRVGKLSAVEMLAENYDQKASLKEKEIELKKMELQFQIQKFENCDRSLRCRNEGQCSTF